MTTIQVRIDEKTKKQAQKILNDIGLDMSSAIKMYFKQITIKKGIPFRVVTENGLTPEEEESILRAAEEAKRGINVTRTGSWKETKKHLDNLKKKK